MSRAAPEVPPEVSVLAPFARAGVLGHAEVHLAAAVARLARREAGRRGVSPVVDDLVLLAVAVASRAPRSGHVCIELGDVERIEVDRADRRSEDSSADADGALALPWPEPAEWALALEASPWVAGADDAAVEPLLPIVWDGRRLYLQRLWRDETDVARTLTELASRSNDEPPPEVVTALERSFGTAASQDRQHAAALRAVGGGVTVITGGPGTGKTRAIARLLVAELDLDPDLRVALCAPTGKAASRMADAVASAVAVLAEEHRHDQSVLDAARDVSTSTIHRLLRASPARGFRHNRANPLVEDLVVVDETSMVDLSLMARLLDALRPDARLVLVGDPDQLASVESGTVLADLVEASRRVGSPLAGRVVELSFVHRFGADSGIAAFADAVRSGDDERALQLLESDSADLQWVRPESTEQLSALKDRVVAGALDVVEFARAGERRAALAAASGLKVLAATRAGPQGLHAWQDLIEARVAETIPQIRSDGRWAVGRPQIVTRNDPLARVANGDTGVVVDVGGRRVLAVGAASGVSTMVPVARLDRIEPWWAMTVHKSQGSEFDTAVVCLPDQNSRALSRELLFTGATRARSELVVVADEASLRRAIQTPAARASGLADRLGGTGPDQVLRPTPGRSERQPR